MKLYKLSGILLLSAFFTLLAACEEETTTIGSSISRGEVEITIDTISYSLNAKPIRIESFDSKTGNLMVGSIQHENYGNLDCSFVARLMCSGNLEVPDSLFYPERVDSVKLILGAERSGITGDSLAPQRLTVYKLTEQLPSNIDNTFNPEGYYNPSDPFASRSYTLSEIASSDSAFYKNSYVDITVDLPLDFGKEVFQKYKSEPSIFQWPQTMAKEFLPGIFVKPTFGNGCVANITSVFVAIYYYNLTESTAIVDGDTTVVVKHVNNMAVPFTISPEVLSSNNIKYAPSRPIIEKNESVEDGEVVITTPGGYIAQFIFPAKDLINRYEQKNTHLATVNELTLYLPAESFDEEAGFGMSKNLLMVKTSEYDTFFKENKIPDNLTSFTGTYDSTNKRYFFSSMREYFIDLLSKKEITEEDVTFTLVPVEIETETVSGYYGSGTSYVTKCVPYTSKPSMTLLKTNEASVIFSFSSQMID